MRLRFNPTIIDFQFAATDGEFRGQARIYNDDKAPAWRIFPGIETERVWIHSHTIKRNIWNKTE